MPVERLTDKRIATAKAGPGERLELWDEQVRGLCLRVSSSAKKVWIWRYRTDDGTQRRMTLGDYSEKHGLKWARAQVEEMRVAVRRGADPVGARRLERAQAQNQPIKTFGDLIDAYLKACEAGHYKPKGKQKREATLKGERKVLDRNVRPALGRLRVEEVTKAEIRKLLNDMLDRKVGAQTNKTHALVRQVFNYGVFTERCASNPAALIQKPAAEAPRDRMLSDKELSALWNALEHLPSDLRLPAKAGQKQGARVYAARPIRVALQLAMLLLVRRREIAGMRRSELDLDQGIWTIPAGRGKASQTLIVPLPPRAAELIKEALQLSTPAEGEPGEPVFPSPRGRDRPIDEGAITHVQHRLTKALGLPQTSPHDLRRTAATAMASERIGLPPFIIGRALGHQSDTGGAPAVTMRHYAQHSYTPEKRRALEAWEALLLEVVGERRRDDNVRAIKIAAA